MMESIQTGHPGRGAARNGGVSEGELERQDSEGKDLGRPGQVKTKGVISIY